MKKQIFLSMGLLCCLFMVMGCTEFLDDLLGGGSEEGAEETHDENNDSNEDVTIELVDCPNAASFDRADCQLSFALEHDAITRGCLWITDRISEPNQKRFGFRIEAAASSANPGSGGILEIAQYTEDGSEIILDQLDNPTPSDSSPWTYASTPSGSGQCATHGCGDGGYLIYLAANQVSDCAEYDIAFFVVLGP